MQVRRIQELVGSAIFQLQSRNRLVRYRRFLEVGDGTYGHEHLVIHRWAEVGNLRIGNYCSIADNVHILLGGNHRSDWVAQYPFSTTEAIALGKLRGDRTGCVTSHGDVEIRHDVWIGSHAFILSGVHIGEGAVVGARSVITKDVPPYSIWAGNPARLIRFRFSKSVIDQLLSIAWWEWPPSVIEQNADTLCSFPSPQILNKLHEIGAAAVETPSHS